MQRLYRINKLKCKAILYSMKGKIYALQFSHVGIWASSFNQTNLFFHLHLGIPTDWCLENVAKLLKLCGESVCFDVLGNKAMNGRVHELSYLGYYLGQVLTRFY